MRTQAEFDAGHGQILCLPKFPESGRKTRRLMPKAVHTADLPSDAKLSILLCRESATKSAKLTRSAIRPTLRPYPELKHLLQCQNHPGLQTTNRRQMP